MAAAVRSRTSACSLDPSGGPSAGERDRLTGAPAASPPHEQPRRGGVHGARLCAPELAADPTKSLGTPLVCLTSYKGRCAVSGRAAQVRVAVARRASHARAQAFRLVPRGQGPNSRSRRSSGRSSRGCCAPRARRKSPDELGIAAVTVRRHTGSVERKLGVSTRAEVVALLAAGHRGSRSRLLARGELPRTLFAR